MKKVFGIVAGPRLGGKSTLAGTLPGRTVLLQAAVLESGSRSALAIARKRGNKLRVETFPDLVSFWAMLDKAAKDPEVDNIYIDGYSAISDIRWGQDDCQKVHKTNNFAAYDILGKSLRDTLREIKKRSDHKNVWLTIALKIEQSAGGAVTDAKLEAVGKMGTTELTKLGEVVVTVVQVPTEAGMRRVMITKSQDFWPGRIDGVLDEDNPGVMDPDLSQVMKLVNNLDEGVVA